MAEARDPRRWGSSGRWLVVLTENRTRGQLHSCWAVDDEIDANKRASDGLAAGWQEARIIDLDAHAPIAVEPTCAPGDDGG